MVLASASCYTLSFPNFLFGNRFPFISHILAFLWPIPFFSLLDSRKKGNAFITGFITGMIVNYAGFYWLIETLKKYGQIPGITSFLIISIMVAYLSLYWGIFGYFIALYKNLPVVYRIVLYSSVFIILQYLKSHLFTGFTWLGLEYTQYLNPLFIQTADLLGPYFIAWIVFIIGYLIYLIVFNPETRVKYALAVMMIFSILYGYGIIRTITLKPVTTIAVGAIQPSLSAEVKDSSLFQDRNLKIYLSQSQELVKRNQEIKLIVWPETALRRPLRYDIEKSERIAEFTEINNLSLILGNEDYWYAGNTKESLCLRNGAAVYHNGKGPLTYHKIHLVPFGEFIPLRELWIPFKKYYNDINDFSRGEERTVFHGYDGVKIAVLVCYEIIFPEDVAKFVREGANLLANVTNNIWYGVSAGPKQDVAFTVFRAVETRCPVVRSANNGISNIVSGKGRILKSIALNLSLIHISEPTRPY